jgi:hypothetical protein
MNKRYSKFFKEAFNIDSREKVVTKICNILAHRVGTKFHISALPEEIINSEEGRLSGIVCTMARGERIRFNWEIGSSATIHSIDYWKSIKLQPDITIDLKGNNVVECINAITEILKSNEVGEYLIEAIEAHTGGQTSQAIADSINAWSKDMSIEDKDLEHKRLSELFKNYEYWYSEVRKDNFKQVTFDTFRNYLLKYLQKYNLNNIFMRTIVAREAGREKIIVSDKVEQKNFDKKIFGLSLEDTFALVERELLSLFQGLKVATIICGKAGMGKTQIVADLLDKYKDEYSLKIKYMKGAIRRPIDLFNFLVRNNTAKTVIALDDVDNVFREYKKYEGILKAALDTNMRLISIVGDEKKEEILLKNKIILISNYTANRIPEPIFSRTLPIEIKADSASTLDYIEQNLDSIMENTKQITLEMKKEVLDLLRSAISDIKHIDFRVFRQVLVYRATDPLDPLWKKYALMLVASL